jgi:MMPL family
VKSAPASTWRSGPTRGDPLGSDASSPRSDRVLKLFGISMATAVFLDALVIRTILLPAVLQLMGRRTWAFPSWLHRRLPRLAIEPEAGGRQLEPALDEAA